MTRSDRTSGKELRAGAVVLPKTEVIGICRTERPVRTASISQVRQPVYQRSVARLKKYERPLAELLAELGVGSNGEFKNKNERRMNTDKTAAELIRGSFFFTFLR